jgi:hypothetical protein
MRSFKGKASSKVNQGTMPSHVISVSESQAKVVPPSKKARNAAVCAGVSAAGVAYAALAAALCYAL